MKVVGCFDFLPRSMDGSSFQEVCTFTWSHLASSSIRVDSLPWTTYHQLCLPVIGFSLSLRFICSSPLTDSQNHTFDGLSTTTLECTPNPASSHNLYHTHSRFSKGCTLCVATWTIQRLAAVIMSFVGTSASLSARHIHIAPLRSGSFCSLGGC